jgi:pyroglutamyl-peptidase
VTQITLSLLLATALSSFAMHAEEPQPVILLTGFEPFERAKINPSWETVKLLQGRTLGGYRVETLQLPVVYDEVEKPLLAAIKKHQPKIVIAFGAAKEQFCIETLARNEYDDERPLDNKSNPPPRKKIVAEGPAEIKTALPVEAIAQVLKELKISAKISSDAGGYLCNECFYHLMRQCEDVPLRGFIHVPLYGQTDPLGNTIDQALLTKAVEAIVLAVAKTRPAAAKP